MDAEAVPSVFASFCESLSLLASTIERSKAGRTGTEHAELPFFVVLNGRCD
jgi:hypothetical protein